MAEYLDLNDDRDVDYTKQEQWRNLELYEKKRVRQNRHRLLLGSITLLLFLGLCSLPVIEERLPKWKTLIAARRISVEIEKLKTLSIKNKSAMRLLLLSEGKFQLEMVDHCAEPGIQVRSSESGNWAEANEEIKVLDASETSAFAIKLAVNQVCFDPVIGLGHLKHRQVIIVAPVKDLSEKRLDRASYVILEGDSAKISIN